MKNLVALVLILLSITLVGFRIQKGIVFDQNVSGILKRAADANTIDLAKQELGKAINYLEKNNLTTGHTSMLWETPDEDVGFWYQNLKASHTELDNLKSVSALERTNVLMKLRETLLDTGEKTSVTVPEGLAVYPDNKFWAALMILAITLGSAGFIILGQQLTEWEKLKKLETENK